jgi:hypothetical protein
MSLAEGGRRPQDSTLEGDSEIPTESETPVPQGTVVPEQSSTEDIQSDRWTESVTIEETSPTKTALRRSGTTPMRERTLRGRPQAKGMTELSSQASYKSFRRFVRNASLTSALLLAVFSALYLQNAVPATVAVGVGTALLIATAAFGHTWFGLREQ